MNKKILVTGGAGFIGSHTCVELLDAGFQVIVIDNLVNSSAKSLNRVEEITGKSLEFHKIDLLDKSAVDRVFKMHPDIYAVIHFAGLKAVGESGQIPLEYYHNNVTGTILLLQVMRDNNIKNIVFSSSATVYGSVDKLPLTEDTPLDATNPYGRTKLFIEQIIKDVCVADKAWNCVVLRYFNPVGAHKSGKIGENPKGIPNNLMPFILQVAVGKRPFLNVFGNDYNTSDGTGVRDYIHVVDLAKGHIAAINKFSARIGWVVYNLGTGNGCSVLQMVAAMKKASNREIKYTFAPRREGDVPVNYADPSLATRELKWKAQLGLDEMCRDAWNWAKNNPNGYEDN